METRPRASRAPKWTRTYTARVPKDAGGGARASRERRAPDLALAQSRDSRSPPSRATCRDPSQILPDGPPSRLPSPQIATRRDETPSKHHPPTPRRGRGRHRADRRAPREAVAPPRPRGSSRGVPSRSAFRRDHRHPSAPRIRTEHPRESIHPPWRLRDPPDGSLERRVRARGRLRGSETRRRARARPGPSLAWTTGAAQSTLADVIFTGPDETPLDHESVALEKVLEDALTGRVVVAPDLDDGESRGAPSGPELVSRIISVSARHPRPPGRVARLPRRSVHRDGARTAPPRRRAVASARCGCRLGEGRPPRRNARISRGWRTRGGKSEAEADEGVRRAVGARSSGWRRPRGTTDRGIPRARGSRDRAPGAEARCERG